MYRTSLPVRSHTKKIRRIPQSRVSRQTHRRSKSPQQHRAYHTGTQGARVFIYAPPWQSPASHPRRPPPAAPPRSSDAAAPTHQKHGNTSRTPRRPKWCTVFWVGWGTCSANAASRCRKSPFFLTALLASFSVVLDSGVALHCASSFSVCPRRTACTIRSNPTPQSCNLHPWKYRKCRKYRA